MWWAPQKLKDLIAGACERLPIGRKALTPAQEERFYLRRPDAPAVCP
jgi:hypothetical protein